MTNILSKHFGEPSSSNMLRHLGGPPPTCSSDIYGSGAFAPGTLTPDLFFSENRLPGRFITPSEFGETVLLDFLRSVRHCLDLSDGDLALST